MSMLEILELWVKWKISIYLFNIFFLIPLALQVHSMSVVKVQDVTLMVYKKKTIKKTEFFYFGYTLYG